MSAATLERAREYAEQLTPEEKISLAEHLWATVPADPSIEQAWLEEAERRSKDIDEGKAKLKPWSEIQAELKGHLENRRR
jgi:putative addiction module component (TIGR02574 family)